MENKFKITERDISFGMELEWGDIPKSTKIPETLGKWEYSEFDIINMIDPYKLIPVDPKGINPPVGGEINTYPTYGYEAQVEVVKQIKDLFEHPTAACVSHTHIHVRIDEWENDVEIVKKILKYYRENHKDIIKFLHQYDESLVRKKLAGLDSVYLKKAIQYFKNDGGRNVGDIVYNNIMNASNYEEMLRTMKLNREGKLIKMIPRSGINFLTLQTVGTIEFRMFRCTTNIEEIHGALKVANDIVLEALSDNPRPFLSWFKEKNYKIPKFWVDRDVVKVWVDRKLGLGKDSLNGGNHKNRELWKPLNDKKSVKIHENEEEEEWF